MAIRIAFKLIMKPNIIKITDNETQYHIFICLSNDNIAKNPDGDRVRWLNPAKFTVFFR